MVTSAKAGRNDGISESSDLNNSTESCLQQVESREATAGFSSSATSDVSHHSQVVSRTSQIYRLSDEYALAVLDDEGPLPSPTRPVAILNDGRYLE